MTNAHAGGDDGQSPEPYGHSPLRVQHHTVSIITATLNRPSLQDACRSVGDQTFADWHHYVLGDGVLPVDYADPRRTTLGFSRPLGAYEPSLDKPDGTPNPILRWALQHLDLGKFVCFLDDDNAYKPDFLQKMLDALTGSNAGIAICALEDCRQEDLHDGYPELGRCDHSGFLVYKKIAVSLGWLPASIDRDNIEDYEFIRRSADRYGWVRVPEKLVFFGLHPRILPQGDRRQAGQ